MKTPLSRSGAGFNPVTDQNRFLIYYGWLIADPSGTPNEEAQTMASARPGLVIASFNTFEPKFVNLSQQVLALFHGAGARVCAYVDTDYGKRDLETVIGEAGAYFSQNVDGVFYDQVYNFLDDTCLSYYQNLYDFAHSQGKLVIVNPGIAQPGEEIMKVTDILMVEHAWRDLYQLNPWFDFYPAERFMGNSSNEHPWLHPEYQIDYSRAVRDTREAWANGVGWHFSTDRYTSLPPWFAKYSARLREL